MNWTTTPGNGNLSDVTGFCPPAAGASGVSPGKGNWLAGVGFVVPPGAAELG
jgi:hypothetical protein